VQGAETSSSSSSSSSNDSSSSSDDAEDRANNHSQQSSPNLSTGDVVGPGPKASGSADSKQGESNHGTQQQLATADRESALLIAHLKAFGSYLFLFLLESCLFRFLMNVRHCQESLLVPCTTGCPLLRRICMQCLRMFELAVDFAETQHESHACSRFHSLCR
jgi:hypothetical protein